MVTMTDRSSSWNRYEVKYLVDETRAAWVRSFCQSNLPHNPYSAKQPDGQYPIDTVYLDSPRHDCLRGTLERRGTRQKIRVRTYHDRLTTRHELPAFFEIKRKSHGVVYKTRAKVPPGIAKRVLWTNGGYGVDTSELDETTQENLGKFMATRSEMCARPQLAVHYTREAFQSPTADRVRISFDRNLHYGLVGLSEGEKPRAWWPAKFNWVILEIKFTNTYPFWIADLVRAGNISRRGVCKYVTCHQASEGITGTAVA